MMDFTDMKHSPMGYNVLSAVRYDEETDSYSEQDIMTAARAAAPAENYWDPYWDYATWLEMEALIVCVLEALPEEEHHMEVLQNWRDFWGIKCLPVCSGNGKPSFRKALPLKSGIYLKTEAEQRLHRDVLNLCWEKN
ncbi:MAG TPA: hypothetical protein H9722_04380 [Candidatus Mediterraneibacter pullistercoris]|nr:hypothetical protein [Candidatus Mediterraneibacter pullistercoris]